MGFAVLLAALALAAAAPAWAQSVSLRLSPASISEGGGVASVTASLNTPNSAAVTVTVSVAPVASSGARAADYTLTGTTLTIAANTTASAGTVTITAVNNDIDAPDKMVRVAGSAAGGGGSLTGPADVTLTIADNEPSVTATTWRNGAPTANDWDITTSPLLAKTTAQPLAVRTRGGRERLVDFWACATRDATQPTQGYTNTGPGAGCTQLTTNNTPNSITLTQAMIDNDGVVIVVLEESSGRHFYLYAEWVPIVSLPEATLILSSSSIRENGGVATVTAVLDKPASGAATVTVAASPGAGTDFTLSGNTRLVFANGATASSGTVTITAMDDSADAPNAQVTISGSVAGDIRAPEATTLTLIDDEGTPMVTLGLSPSSISEGGGVATVTARLSGASSAAVTVTVAAAPSTGATARDFTLSLTRTLTIAAGATASSGTVTVTGVNNDMRGAAKQVTVSGSAAGGGVANPASVTLTVTDNDGTVPTGTDRRWVTGLGTYDVTTASLKGKTDPQTITVTGRSLGDRWVWACAYRTVRRLASNRGPAPTEGAICSRATGSGGSRTIRLTQAMIDNDGVVVLVTHGGLFPDGITTYYYYGEWLPITAVPKAALALSSSTISETGGVTTVTATLDEAAAGAATVTVTVTPGAGAMVGDATLSATTELVFASGATASTGTVTITAVGNSIDSPDKRMLVAGEASGDVRAPAAVTLTLTDDDALPVVTLALSSASISENGEMTTVTAKLSGASSEAVVVTVTAADDFTLSGGGTLTIAAGATASGGDGVTLTAEDNDGDAPDKQVTVAATASGGNGVAAPTGVALTLTDDDDAPGVTLSLSAASIGENGGETTVAAALSHPSSADTTVTVTAVDGAYTVGSDAVIVIAAGDTVNAGDTATVAAVDDSVYQGGADGAGRATTVTGTAANDQAAANSETMAVTGAALTLTDDETAPMVTLALAPASIAENGGVASVTATLSGASSAEVVVTVGAAAGAGAGADDFTLSMENTLTIAANATASSGDVTVTAEDNDVHAANKSVTVSGTVAGGHGVGNPANVTLTITEDDTLPTVALALSPASISETGGVSSVTATLSGKSSEAVVVTVGAAAGTGAVAGDFDLSAATTLTIAAGSTASSGDVTVMANGNDVDAPDKSVTVSGTATGGNGVAAPSDVTLTLSDDETLPTVTLALSSSSISETGGVATVTATLSGKSSAAVVATVGAAAGTGAVAGDFTLSSAKTLTIAAGQTASAGTVTVTANGNLVDTNDKQVTISATMAGGHGVAAPATVDLTLTDDDTAGVTFNPTTMTLTEEGASKTFTFVLDTEPPPGLAQWVSVGLYPDIGLALGGDNQLSPMRGQNYTFTTTTWDTPQTVTVNALADSGHEDNTLRLRYVVADYGLGDVGRNVAHAQRPIGVTVTVIDDDKPAVTLALSESSISEDGGVATVTATLDKAANEGTTVTVSASPGAGTDFTQAGTLLTIAAAATTSTGVVTLTAMNNTADAPDKEVTVSATVDGGDGASDPDDVTLTISDDEAAPGVTLALSDDSIAENGGSSVVSATLSHPSSAATTVTVTAVSGAFTVPSGAAGQIVIDAGDTTAASDTVTVMAVNDSVHQGSSGRQATVTATVANDQASADSTTMAVTTATLTLTDDETLPTVTLALSQSSISETGGVSSVTATLSGASSEAVTVTVGAAAGTGAVAADFAQTGTTLTIAAGSTASAGVVTVTANGNDVDSPDKSVTVSGTVTGGNGVVAPSNLTLTLTDDETLPIVTLALSESSISEQGGEATVTATLSGKSSEAVTVTVGAVAGTGAVAADFGLSAAKTLTIAVGQTTSAGTVTVTASGNDVHSGDKSVTVSGTVTGGNGVVAPSDVTLTLSDDETLPTVTLALSSSSISETGGVATVTATLSGKSSEGVTVTVGAAAGTGAVAADFDLSSAKTLTIAAGTTASAGTVTVTANSNDRHSGPKSVTISGTAVGGNNIAAPSNLTLTLTDDESLPTVTLALSSSSISESSGVATVTATLSGKSSEAVTVTVGAAPGANAAAADFDLSSNTKLTIAAGATASAGTVTVTANGNNVHSPDKSVTVSGMVTGGNNVGTPSSLTLTLEDDDTATLTLALSDPISGEADAIKELATAPGSERMTTVTARLSTPASAAVTIAVSATAGTNAAADDFSFSANTKLIIAAGATASTGVVTITAVDDRIDSLVDDTVTRKKVVVKGAPSSTLTIAAPADVELRIWEDDRAALVTAPAFPRCRRAPCPVWLSVAEGASETFTVKLNSQPTTNITVAVKSDESDEGLVSAGGGTAAASTRLTFTASNWETAQTVTLHGVSDQVVDGDDDYTLRLFPDTPDEPTDAYHVIGGASVRPQTVRTTDVDVAGLTVSESTLTVTEGGAEQTFTVRLTSKPTAAVTVTATSGDGDEVRLARAAGDANAQAFATAKTLVFSASDWNATQTLRVTAVDDDRDDPASLAVEITLDPASSDGKYNGLDDETVDVTKNDDDPTPTLTLARAPAAISESGGVATVTATLSGKSDEAVVATVAAAPGTGASAADFTLSMAKTLTIAAGATTSSGVVTVTANGNMVDSPDKQVTISASVAGGHGLLSNPSDVALTLTDDDALPTVALALSASAVSENGGVATVTATLSGASSEAVTVTVDAAPGTGAAAADFDLSTAKTLTIAAGSTTSAGAVTVTANDNMVDAPDKSVTVSGTVVGGNGVANPTAVTLTLSDDDALPTLALALSPASISETNGVASVTATLSGASSEAVTVTVAAAPGTGAVAADFALSAARTLTIAAGVTVSGGDVTVTASDNDVDAPNKQVTVSGTAAGGNNVANPTAVTLTLENDEAAPTVTVTLSSASISENGGMTTASAVLSGKSSAATTVTVQGLQNIFTVPTGAGGRIVIAAGATTSADRVTITALDNDVDAGANAPYVLIGETNDHRVNAAAHPQVTITDDDTAGLALAPTPSTTARLQTDEGGGTASFTVALTSQPTGDVELDLAVAGSGTSEGAVSPGSLTFTASNWQTAQTATLTGQDDTLADGSQNYQVTVEVDQTNTADDTYDMVATATVYAVNHDDEYGLVTGTVSGQATEGGGTASFTVRLRTQPAQAVTVTVSSQDASEGRVSPSTLTFQPGDWSTTQAVTVTGEDDNIDDGTVTWNVRLDPASGDTNYNALANVDVPVTTTDNDAAPGVTLALTPAAISENAGVATVRATLSRPSGAATTITVTGVTGAFTVPSGAAGQIVIAAGDTVNASGTVTITAVNDNVHQGSPGRQANVTAIVTNDRASADSTTMAVTAATLRLNDDDAAPGAVLALSPASISENGGTSAVSATLSRASAVATTVTVMAAQGAAYRVGSDATIVIAAFATAAASDTAAITAVDNDIDEPNRTATVTATLTNDRGAGSVTGATLTLEDDDAAPGVTLSVQPATITENGGAAAVSAVLERPSSQPTTVTVTAQSGVFTVPAGAAGRIVIAASATTASGTVTITAVNNQVDATDNMVTVGAAATNGHGVGSVTGASLTISDDDQAAIVMSETTSTSSRLRTSEDGSTATVDITLATGPTANVVIDVTSSNTGEGTASPSSLTFTSSDWQTAQTVTLTGVNDPSPGTADGSQNYRVTLAVNTADTADSFYDALSDVFIYAVNADDELGLDVGTVTGQASEGRGQASFTVKLATDPGQATMSSQAVTVTVTSQDAGEGRVSPSALTFTAGSSGNWNTNQVVTVTGVDDNIDDGTVTWDVRLDTSSASGSDYNGIADVDVSVTTTDNDDAPGVTLALSPAAISESGGAATVRATLSRPSGAATTITVTGVTGAFTVPSGAAGQIVIADGDTVNASGTVTITAVNDNVHQGSPGRQETVTAIVTNDRASADSTTMAVTGATLRLNDDDSPPGAVLALSPASIGENGGTSAVSATLSRASAVATTVTVMAVSGFYTVGSDATIVVPAGATAASGDTAAITAVDNDIDEPNRTATVRATLTNDRGTGSVTGATLTLEDDETLPVATLGLSPASIGEAGGVTTVTATLGGKSSQAVTLTVASAAGSGAVAADFSQAGTMLTIAAGATASSGRVTIRANDNMAATGSKQVTVSATATGGNGVAAPGDATLTLTDDDTPQTTLALSSSSIGENGGVATVTAVLDRVSAVAVTVTISAAPGAGAVAGDFALSSARTLTFAANATTSTGVVTVTGVNNTTDAPDKSVTVSGTASDSLGLTNDPPSATLTLTDDDAAPGVTLALSDASITENGATTAVSATLSHPSSAATTVTVMAVSGAFTVPAGAAGYIVIAAGDTTAASDTVTITAVDNDTDEPNRMATVTATVANNHDQGAGSVTGVTLTLEDNDNAPTPWMAVTPTRISENGGTATVTLTLTHPSSAATTLTVQAVAGVFTVPTGAARRIVIAAGQTANAADTVTITAVDNRVDAATRTEAMRAQLVNDQGLSATQLSQSMEFTDDDIAGIVMSPTTTTSSRLRTSEDGSSATLTVTLATEPTANVVLDVASLDTTRGMVQPSSLTFTATTWNTPQTVTLTGVDDDPDVADGSHNYQATLTVNQASTADSVYDGVAMATIYAVNADDEYGLSIGNVSGPVSEAGTSATFTVALNTQPAAAVTVAVSSRDAGEGRVAPSTLIFQPGNWDRAQRVTVTGVDDTSDDGDVVWQARLNPASGDPDYNGLANEHVAVTTRDDDDAPAVTLALSRDVVGENGGVATVTATLSHPSGAATTVTVAATAVAPALAADFTQAGATLTVAAGRTVSSGRVTVTAVNNDIDAPDKQVRVAGTAANDRASADSTAMAVAAATLTLEDDDEKGLAFDPPEFLAVMAGTATAYTLALTSEPVGPVTVTVPQGGGVAPSPSSLTFTGADWETAQTVTVTAAPDDDDSYADAAVALIHSAAGGDYGGVTGTIQVASMGDTVVAVAPGAGNDYGIEGRRVTVRAAAGVPEGIEVDLAGLGAGQPLTVTLDPQVAAETVEKTAADGFGLGPAAGRTVVDISVSGTVPGVRICLPVTEDVRQAARERPLLLLHYDGSSWVRVEGAEVVGDMICAPRVVAFSPFAVGYVDRRPVFAATLDSQSYIVDEAIRPLALPALREGTGDPPVTYALTGPGAVETLSLPPGLSFDPATRTLSGLPSEPFEAQSYRWTATDLDGASQQVTQIFTIEVVANLEMARARLKAINRSILPELSRAMWGSALDAISSRLEVPAGGGGGGLAAQGLDAAAGFLRSKGEALEDGGSSWKELLGGEGFALALDGGDGVSGGGGGSSLVLWGAGEWRDLEREQAALDWSGDLFSAHLGADLALGDGFTAGLALSRYESEIAYSDRSDADEGAIRGDHETAMSAVHPYLGWSGADGSRLWTALGYGRGELRMNDTAIRERYGWQESDSSMLAAAMGGSVRLYQGLLSSLDLKASVEATRYDLDDNGEVIAALTVATQRARLAASGSRSWTLDGGRLVTPSLEAGLRWDGGDGATGMGVELGGSIALSDPGGGMGAELGGRALLAHGGGMEEWGASGALRLLPPDGDGRGLSLALAPAWGVADSGLARLWQDGMAAGGENGGGGGAGRGARLEGELGYGLAAWDGAATTTPYAAMTLAEDERRYSLGQRLGLGSALSLAIEASRNEGASGSAEHGIGLELQLSW